MTAWNDRRILDLFGIDLPILQAADGELHDARSGGVAVGPKPAALAPWACASLTPAAKSAPISPPSAKPCPRPLKRQFLLLCAGAVGRAGAKARGASQLSSYYRALGIDPDGRPFPIPAAARLSMMLPVRWSRRAARRVVSFHFGLPARRTCSRGCGQPGPRSSRPPTTVREARWLEEQGCDAVIAMGAERPAAIAAIFWPPI